MKAHLVVLDEGDVKVDGRFTEGDTILATNGGSATASVLVENGGPFGVDPDSIQLLLFTDVGQWFRAAVTTY